MCLTSPTPRNFKGRVGWKKMKVDPEGQLRSLLYCKPGAWECEIEPSDRDPKAVPGPPGDRIVNHGIHFYLKKPRNNGQYIVRIAAFGKGFTGHSPLDADQGVAPLAIVQKIIVPRWALWTTFQRLKKRYQFAEVVRAPRP